MFVPPGEKIIETRKCRILGEDFVITEKDAEMYEQLAPVFADKKCTMPFPTLCPNERQIRRMMWRNYDHFYKGKCSLTGKEIISTYKPGTPYKVASLEAWWSDDWNPYEYSQKIDFSRPFFDQFRDLDQLTVHLPLSVTKSENSNFTNFSINNRNCYLCSRVAGCEECYHDFLLAGCKNCFDCSEITDSEYLYECVRTVKSYHSFYCTDSENCRDCYFLRDCSGCVNCFGSCNLKNAEYVFNNEQLSENEYRKKIGNILGNLTDGDNTRQSFLLHSQSFPKKYAVGFQNQNVIGNYTFSSNNIVFGFGCHGCDNLRYPYGGFKVKDSIDVSFGYECEKSMEVCGAALGYGILFCVNPINQGHNLFYSKDCVNAASDCFGCISLKKGKHCILNTAYSQQEYETLSLKLVDHMRSTSEWGEFFPAAFSPYAYNESSAQRHFPATKDEVMKKGLPWYEEEKNMSTSIFQILPITQYDEKIVGYDTAKKNIDNLLASILICCDSGKPFKLIPQELAFYIQNSLPIPLRHPQVRLEIRMKQSLPVALYGRACDECGQPFLTSYAPERPEKILCEECYRKLVY